MNDLIRFAMVRATERFGGKDGVFNGACFSGAFTELAGVTSGIDGKIVSAMLCGRPDVEVLKGGAHYRLIENT